MYVLIISALCWGLLHSWASSLRFKALLQQILGAGFMKLYRLLFNLFSIISIAPVLYLALSLPDRLFYQVPASWVIVMSMGRGLSALLLLVSLLQTDMLSFAGLRQLFEEERKGNLVTGGVYRLVRHPLYTFGLLTVWLSPSVSLNSFGIYLTFTAYILVGIIFEERKLLREFGQAYADYRSATPMLIPGLKFGGNK